MLGVTPSKKGERYLSPAEVRILVYGIGVFPFLLGILLIVLTPLHALSNPVYWASFGGWTLLGAILSWHDIARQVPEAESLRRERSRSNGSHPHVKWVAIALLVLVLGMAKLFTGAPPESTAGAFVSGIAGAMLATGAGYVYELAGREKLLYCATCQGHRWYFHYRGQLVCGVCGLPWAGLEEPWVRPPIDSRERRIHHAMFEFLAAGPMITFAGIAGTLVLPELGLGGWVGIPFLMMFGGLVSTVLLGRRYRRRMAQLQK